MIYKANTNTLNNHNNNNFLYANISIGCDSILESPVTPEFDIGNGNTVKFQFMTNTSKAPRHSLRLKVEQINDNKSNMSISINPKTGQATLEEDKIDKNIPSKIRKEITILAGAFALYSLDYLNKAFGYYSNDNKFVFGNDSYVASVIKSAEDFNNLPKTEKDRYLRKSKSTSVIKK